MIVRITVHVHSPLMITYLLLSYAVAYLNECKMRNNGQVPKNVTAGMEFIQVRWNELLKQQFPESESHLKELIQNVKGGCHYRFGKTLNAIKRWKYEANAWTNKRKKKKSPNVLARD